MSYHISSKINNIIKDYEDKKISCDEMVNSLKSCTNWIRNCAIIMYTTDDILQFANDMELHTKIDLEDAEDIINIFINDYDNDQSNNDHLTSIIKDYVDEKYNQVISSDYDD